MKVQPTQKALIVLVSFILPMLASAANVTMTASDAFGTSSLNSAGKWSNGQAPSSTNDYFSGPYFIRTPADAGGITTTFVGHSLTLSQPGTGVERSIIFKGGSGDVIVINNLTNVLGGILENGGSGNSTVTYTGNQFTIAANSAVDANQGPMIVGYPLVGAEGVILTNAGGNATGITYTNDNSGFKGKFYISTVNYGNGGGNTTVILGGPNSQPGNPSIFTPDQILLAGGCTLEDTYGLDINNSNGGITLGGNATISSTATTIIGEPIADNGGGFSLTTGGSGTLVLSNADNTYSGGTVVSAGTLQIGMAHALPVGAVTVNGTLNLNAFYTTIDSLNGSGSVDTYAGGTPTFTVGANGGSGTFSGYVANSSGTLSLTKVGAGTQALAGGYTYSGTTLAAGGTLTLTTSSGVLPNIPGDLVVSNGAVLAVDASTGIALPANNIVVGDSTLEVMPSAGANGINANGNLILQDNATLNINFGTLNANPTGIAINLAGAISAPGTNVVVSVAALGMQPGTITLVKYSGTPLANITNFKLDLAPGIFATLVNNTANDSIDLNVAAVAKQLTWYGAGGTQWDLATFNWKNNGVDSVYHQYTNGSIISGDGVTFDDTLTNDFINPQPTNIVVTGVFSPYPFVVNSTLPYSFSGPGGIAGTTSLVVSNTGSVTLLTSNSFTGGVSINGTSSVVITNDDALGTSAGGVTLNGGTLQINGNTTSSRTISVPVSSTIGVAANSTAILGGAVSGSTLNTTGDGALILSAADTFTGDLLVHSGTLVIDSGGSVISSNYDDAGQSGSDNGTLTLKGAGALTTTSDFNVGDVDSSVGVLNVMDSATLNANQFFVGSANATGSTASGTVNQSGGTITEVSTAVGAFAVGGRTSTTGVGVYNLSGGVLTANAGMRVGGTGIGTFNQSGGLVNAIGGVNVARIAGSTGTYNLNGGTLASSNVTSSTHANATFNFNGGTLLAAFNPPNPWVSGLSQAMVMGGGAVIDSSNYSVTISQPLLDGGGNGGLTKNGTGTLTLSGVNTFTGPITNNNGMLLLNSASTYAGGAVVNAGTLQLSTASSLGGNVIVNDGAVLSIVQIGSATATVGNMTLGHSAQAGATLALALAATDNPSTPLVNCGILTLNGTNTINLAGSVKVGTTTLIKTTGSIAGSGTLTNLVLPQGAVGTISTSFDGTSTTISAVIASTGPGLVWSGSNGNLWDINTTTNWLLNSTPTTYHQVVIPGDAVTFNDSGSGTVLLSNSVGPASLLISNNTQTYTFGGPGSITGPTALLKLGTGTAIMNLTNNSYTGDTMINNGTLQLGNPLAIPSSANLVIGANGTLELAGSSPTVGELTGSGTVNNNNGVNPTLTIGSGSGGTWSGTITNTGGAGVALHKVGSSTWVVAGNNYLDDGQPFNDSDQINQGTVIITNGGTLNVTQLQLQIANGVGQTSTVVVAGGTLDVAINTLSVGYGDPTANGTLIVNSGTLMHGGTASGAFAAVANSIDVGAQGATGTLIVNGGQVLNNQILYLGDGAGANGILYLNGGLLQASGIAPNGTPASSVAYFNGGTLQAVTNSSDFITGTTPYIQRGGLILDDGGYAVSQVSQGFQDDPNSVGGPLIKAGAGTLYLDAYNSYTGTTVVTNGTLAGAGSLTGPVVVAPAGNIGAGDAGSVGSWLTINNSLTLQGHATFRISNNGGSPVSDQLIGPTTVNYGGVLIITNFTSDGTPLANGESFQLFNTSAHNGNFISIVGSPGAGLAYSFNPASGMLSVVTAVVKSAPQITNISVSGTTLMLNGTNGTSNGQYVLLGSTNLALPLSQWTPLLTNSFDGNGNLNLSTNIVNLAVPQEFYILSQ